MGAGVNTRATIVAVLLIGAACLSSCAPQPHLDQSTVPQFKSGPCGDPDPNIRFQLIRDGRCVYGYAPPSSDITVQQVDEVYKPPRPHFTVRQEDYKPPKK
jgi:hypothetical protein